jgi:S-adenosylmethionine hydrolase
VSVGERHEIVTWQGTFGEVDPGVVLLYEDADYAGLGIAVNQASVAERFGLESDTHVRIEPA